MKHEMVGWDRDLHHKEPYVSQHQQEDSKDLVNGREEPYDEDNRKIINTKLKL